MIINNKIISGENMRKYKEPITGLDMCMPKAGFYVVLYYDHMLDENFLIRSLKISLTGTPQFAGRILQEMDEIPSISTEHNGVLLTSILYYKKLENYGIHRDPQHDEHEFVNKIEESNFDEHVPLFQIRLSTFENCSVLGFSMSHVLGDSAAFWNFLTIWSGVSRGEPVESMSFPRNKFQEKSVGSGAINNCIFPVIDIADTDFFTGHEFVMKAFRISEGLLRGLEMEARSIDGANFTRQDIMLAYIWILVFSCCRIENKKNFSLTLIQDVREVIGLNKNYLGNAICTTFLERDVKEIVRSELATIAAAINRRSNQITKESIFEDLAYWTARAKEKSISTHVRKAFSLVLEGGLLVNNWTHFPVYDIDFGSGKAVWFDIPRAKKNEVATGLREVWMVTAPGGDIDCYIELPKAEMENLDRLMNRLA